MKKTKLFGTDGIRGTAGKFPLDPATVRKIGASAAAVFKKQSRRPVIAIGMDTRRSGPAILRELAEPISSLGVEVWDLGVIPTPGVAYIAREYPVSAAIVISASHNPYMDNGIKFFSHRGTKLSDALEEQIEALIRSSRRPRTAAKSAPIRDRRALAAEYERFLRESFACSKGLAGKKIVIDCANGATSALAERIFSNLGASVVMLNCAPDGVNINNNCGSLHPEKLAKAVVKNRAYCGLAFDGDGDRIIFTDEKGSVRDGDYLLAMASLYLKRKKRLRKNTLVTTVMANLGLMKSMKERGIRVRQTPVGDRYVFAEMVRSGSVIGGEQSGHIIFREHLPTGDGMLSAIQILGIACEAKKPFSKLCGTVRKYPQVLINTRVAAKIPVEHLPRASALIREVEKKLGSDGRILVRYSGTENLLRVMIEGRNRAEIGAAAQKISDAAKMEIEAGR